MFEDRLKRRLQRWSAWQARLATASQVREARHRDAAVRHWSRAMARQGEPVRSPEVIKPAKVATLQGTDLANGTEMVNSLGRYWHISRSLADIWPAAHDFICRARERPGETRSVHPATDEAHAFMEAFPNRTLFLDLETCGLAGSAIFLVGLIRASAGQLCLEQLWARNHAEEAGLLGALREIAEDCEVLITFNGKSFDWPQVCDRATLHTRTVEGAIKSLPHLDLLHHARRRYKKQFGDCKLQTLERHVCGRIRTGDVRSGHIPAIYAEYVRTADAGLVRPVLHHNALDLVTLLELAIRLVCDEDR